MASNDLLIQIPEQSVKLAQAGCGYRPPSDPANPVSFTSDTVGVAGNAADAATRLAEHRTGKRIMIGDNLKIYKNFNGNQYVATVRVLKIMEKVGVGTFAVSTIVDGYDLVKEHLNPNADRDGKVVKSIKFGVTVAVGVVGLAIGGIPGIILGVAYYALDKSGLADKIITGIYNEVTCNIAPAVSQKVEDVKREGATFWWQFERALMRWATNGQSANWGY
jgi:hypothetical protein